MSEDSSSKQEPDLAAIEARLAKITPGPWEYDEAKTDPLFVKGNSDAMLVWPDFDYSRENISVKMENADGEFIAHAPADIAALLARARQQDARIEELEAEVKELRGIGLKEFSWSQGGYGGGFECTIVAESLEKAREYIRKFFLNELKTQGNYDGEFMLTHDPWDICDYTPKLSGYYEYHMDAGG
jgi:hypothetical protein